MNNTYYVDRIRFIADYQYSSGVISNMETVINYFKSPLVSNDNPIVGLLKLLINTLLIASNPPNKIKLKDLI